jgi:hypothetical protein
MSFIVLQNSTTADANDINNNFYHVAQGTRYPMAGSTLSYNNGSYDLGSSTYTWKALHVNDIYTDSVSSGFLKILEAESLINATTTSITISGLNGDNSISYEIVLLYKGYNAGSANLFINGNSTTSNYGYITLEASGSSYTLSNVASSTGIPLCDITVTYSAAFCKMSLYTKSDLPRMYNIYSINQVTNTTINNIKTVNGVYNNLTTITSLKLTGYFSPGTHLLIWGNK